MQYKEIMGRKNVVQNVIIRYMPYESQVDVYGEPESRTCSLIISVLVLIYILVQSALFIIIIISL